MRKRMSAALCGTLFAVAALVSQPAVAFAGGVQAFVNGLWPQAQARGVSRSVFDAALGGFQPDPSVIELTRSQPEFAQSVEDYIGQRVSAARIERGQAARQEWRETLDRIEAQYGVSRDVVLAIWGMETNFGGFMGNNNVIRSLATLTHAGYRETFFRNELLTALEILNDGHVTPGSMIGSWAGAMGHTQFMPSSFKAYAVDFTGDGRADIWSSVPDALASSANYLRRHGWRPGETWGYEVRLPDGFDFGRAWSMGAASIGEWERLGVTRIRGQAFPRSGDQARLYLPAGGNGPAFLLLPNFDVIKRYNNSDAYALAVGHLADRIMGMPGFVATWPADAPLTRDERRLLQQKLAQLGFDAGAPDGIVGPRTRSAIIAYQRVAGLMADGHPNGELLQELRGRLLSMSGQRGG